MNESFSGHIDPNDPIVGWPFCGSLPLKEELTQILKHLMMQRSGGIPQEAQEYQLNGETWEVPARTKEEAIGFRAGQSLACNIVTDRMIDLFGEAEVSIILASFPEDCKEYPELT